jgi:hypothetical protein
MRIVTASSGEELTTPPPCDFRGRKVVGAPKTSLTFLVDRQEALGHTDQVQVEAPDLGTVRQRH